MNNDWLETVRYMNEGNQQVRDNLEAFRQMLQESVVDSNWADITNDILDDDDNEPDNRSDEDKYRDRLGL